MAAAPRFFVDNGLRVGASIVLPDAVAHHAQHSLRLRDGAAITLFDGRGGEYGARLVAGRHASAEIVAFDSIERESPLAVTLIQSLASSEKIDWVVEKATELGAARIVLVSAERSVARLDAKRFERKLTRWREVAVAACCQCGRNRVPRVIDMSTPAEAFELARDCEARLLLAPGAVTALAAHADARPVAVAVGPEGGFSDHETALAERAGFVAVSLGPRVLRTETAGPAAVAALQAIAGDFRVSPA
jgi:16S rRNA (uracil1498-N3)-methyltransferase